MSIDLKKYILKETKPADGYVTASDTTDTQEISLTDEKTKISFAKYDDEGNLVPGAVFQIVDEEGNLIEEWTTGNTKHDVVGKLIVGKTYTLKEISTPEGYATAEDKTFTVDDIGKMQQQQVGIKEKTIKVQISKQDITTGKELSGEKLTISKQDGTEIETWVSKDEPHLIENKLIAGESYTLQEIKSPKGYEKADDIMFKVSENGEVDVVKIVNVKEETKIGEVAKNIIQGALPKTGDEIIIYVAIAVVALGCIVFITRKKKSAKKRNHEK